MVNQTLGNLSLVFKALGDPTRLAVIQQLSDTDELSVTKLAEPFQISLPAMMKHLKALEKAGLISQKKIGKERLATLVTTKLQDSVNWISALNEYKNSESENHLFSEYHKSKSFEIREKILKKYLHLVKYVAGRIAIGLPPNVDFNDLVSYGILGLLDAINKYDVSQANKFETYAVSRIRGSIVDELRKLDWAPRLLRKKAREIDRKCKELEEKHGRSATDDEVATALNISQTELNSIYSDLNSTTFLSLDEVWQNDDGNKPTSGLQTVEDSLIANQFHYLQQAEVKTILAQAIKQLPEKEKLVVVLYYYENLTLREIGEQLHISESRVCQIHTELVARIRASLKARLNKEIDSYQEQHLGV